MPLVKISEISQKIGVLPSTIRHYTDIGLIEISDRTDGGQRLYDEEKTLSQLAKIKHLISRGNTLIQVKNIIASGPKKRVLIVDDDSDVVDLIRAILGDERWEFKTASDGFEAGKVLLDYLPDIVTLDLVMPGMDGFKVCQNIRSDPRTKDVKIISITAYDTPEYKQRILDAGADDYLPKPFTPDELRLKVDEVLSKP